VSERPVPHIWQAMTAMCWAMLPDHLALLFEIAAREHLDEGGIEAIAAKIGRPLDNSRTVSVRDGVAIIPIEGAIFPRASLFTAISGGVSVDTIAADFATALADPAITGIVLLIDSPGGDKNGVAETADMVYAARGRKPIVAYGRELVASAAYWIAAAADEVVIASDALVGSIGVVAGVADPSQRGGRSIQFVSSQSPHKRIDPTTETGRARIQARVDTVADLFIATVARYRGVTTAKVIADFGQGDVLIGQRAVDAGLADRLGSFEGVVAELQQRAREPRRMVSAGRIAAQSTGVAMSEQKGRMERFMAWLGGEGDDSAFASANSAASGAPIAGDVGTPAHADTIVRTPYPANASGESEELARLRAELDRRDQAERTRAEAAIATDATTFAEAEIAANRAIPAERDALVAAYTEAATDDVAHPRDAGQASRVAGLRSRQGLRPAHSLTAELLPVREGGDGMLTVVGSADHTPAEGEAPPLTAERWREQRAFTATGRGILQGHGIPASGPLTAEHKATIGALLAAQGLTLAG